MCSKHFLRKSVHMTTQLDPQVVSHCKQASYAECAGESHLQTKFCRLNTNTVKLNGPNIHNPWPSSMAAPLIFEKHSRRPHGSCVLWCCLRRTAPTRKTTWFAQGPRVIICGFCFLRYEDQPHLKCLDWIYPTPHKKGFFFSKYISYGLRKAVKETSLSLNHFVQNFHTPVYPRSERQFNIIIFHFEKIQKMT